MSMNTSRKTIIETPGNRLLHVKKHVNLQQHQNVITIAGEDRSPTDVTTMPQLEIKSYQTQGDQLPNRQMHECTV